MLPHYCLLFAVLRVFVGTRKTKEAAGKCDGNMGHMVALSELSIIYTNCYKISSNIVSSCKVKLMEPAHMASIVVAIYIIGASHFYCSTILTAAFIHSLSILARQPAVIARILFV